MPEEAVDPASEAPAPDAPALALPPAPTKAPRPKRPGLGARIGEWFWRGRAIARAKAISPEERTSTQSVVELADQRGEAAETLWTTGHLAEALRLGLDAFRVADRDLASDPATLRTLGAKERDLDRLERARKAARTPPPERESELGSVDTQRYLDLQAGRRVLLGAHGKRVATTSELRWQRVQRVGGTLVALLAITAAAWLVLRTPPRVDVRASDQFPGAQYAPENAFDANEASEWVLPDGETGWIEGRLVPPRDVSELRVLNGRNAQFGDRAVKEYKVQLFRGGDLLGEHEGSFEQLERAPEWVDIPLTGKGVSRIRFEALSFHQRGAALAEIAWDE